MLLKLAQKELENEKKQSVIFIDFFTALGRSGANHDFLCMRRSPFSRHWVDLDRAVIGLRGTDI